MKTDFTVKRNWGVGSNKTFQTKPESEQTTKRITFKTTTRQRAVVDAYCQANGLELSSFMRSCIAEHLERAGFDLPGDQVEDKNQLKLYPD